MWPVMILSYILMGFSFVSIAITACSGFFDFSISNANHILIALFSSIIYMFTETLILFYFIITGIKIKEIIKANNLDITKYYKPIVNIKIKLFPHIIINMIMIGTTFIIGGAVHNNMISVNIHSFGFMIGIIHYLWLIIFQHRCFIRNTEVLILVYELANDN